MPVIINGEVVPDNDPRAIARRGGSNNSRNRTSQSRSRFGTVGGSSSTGGSAGRPGAPGSRGTSSRRSSGNGGGLASPLSSLEKMIGVEGKTFNVPALMGNPSIDLPVILLFILAFLCVLTNWRVGAGGLLFSYLYYTNQDSQGQGGAATGGR